MTLLQEPEEMTADGLLVEEPVRDDGPGPDGRPPGRLRRWVRDLWAWTALRQTPYGLGPLLVVAGIIFFERFDTQAFNLASPSFVRRGINVGSLLGVFSIVGVVTTIFGIVVGWWADRHKRVPILAVGTFFSGISASLTSLGHSGFSLGAARVGDEALSGGVADVPLYSLVADYYPPESRGRAFAFLGTLRALATIVAVIVAGLSLQHLGLDRSFLIFGIPIALMGLVALVTLREPVRGYFERRAVGADEEVARTEDEPQSLGEAWRTVFAVRTLRRFFVADIITGMAEVPYGVFFVLFLAEIYRLDAMHLAYALLPSAATAALGGFIGGAIVDRLTVRNPGRVLAVFGLFTIIGAVGVAGLLLKPPLILLLVFLAIRSFGSALVGPAAKTVYSQVVPPSVRTQGLQMTALSEVPGIIFGLQFAGIIFAIAGYGLGGYRQVFLFCLPWLVIGGIVTITAGAFFETDRRNAFLQAVAAEEYRRARERGEDKLLVCRGVDVSYDGVQVLFGVDFDVREGEIIALLGTNGAGKSTLLRAISGSQEASDGAIVFNGRDTTHMPPHEVAARGVVHMPGGRGVFPGLSVRDNLLLGTWLADAEDDTTRDLVREVFEIFPVLRERAGEPAGNLSGGEQQMLSLAQAFLMRPKLLMIDELSLGLSPAVVGQLLDVVREIHRRGVTIIVVEQSVNVALAIAERAIFMEKGEVRFFGETKELLARPDILRAVYVKGTGALTSAPASAASRARNAGDDAGESVLLQVQGIEKRFGGVTALDGVSLDLREAEVLGIIGPNGSGKTTLFDIISGFQRQDRGSIVYAGVDISQLGPDVRAKQGLIRRFQDARLFPSLTVFETLLVALEQRLEVRSAVLGAIGAPQARRAERRLRLRAERLIELLGLEAYRDKFVKELSTGLRRIVDLACVLAAEPKVLLLDEPSSGIAQAEAEGLAPLLQRVRHETGCSILIIEHDMPLISAVSDELIALERGTYLTRGRPEDVLNDERVIESYLGGTEAAVRRSGSLA